MSDKSGKASPKRKGKSGKSKDGCWKCGKIGHMAKECRVRFVEEASDANCENQAAGSTTKATNTAAANNSSRVSRVSIHELSSASSSNPSHFFDLSVCNVFSRLNVNMISETVETCSQVISHEHSAFCEPGRNVFTRALRGSDDDSDSRLSRSLRSDECFHYTAVSPIDECIYSSTNSVEFVPCGDATGYCGYELCTLCKLDDYDHFFNIVSIDGGFSMYERALPRRGARSLIRRFDETSHFHLRRDHDDDDDDDDDDDALNKHAFDVRAVRACSDIILDSGSDATVIPIGMVTAGSPAADQSPYLRDAQGSKIETDGVRDISIVLSAVDGSEVILKDRAHASSRVDMPLISYGKLLRHGWGIVPEGGKSFLVHASGAKVEVNFKQNSLFQALSG